MTNEDIHDALLLLLTEVRDLSKNSGTLDVAYGDLIGRIQNGDCPRCKGNGLKYTPQFTGPVPDYLKCERCNGTGKEPKE